MSDTLLHNWFWQGLGCDQLAFYGLAVPSILVLRWLRLPGALLFLQIQVVAGAAA